MSRKKEIREIRFFEGRAHSKNTRNVSADIAMANLIGNSAAHIALLPDSEFAQKEATTYTEDAADTAAGRTWSDREIAEFMELAKKRAVSELKARIKKYGLEESQLDAFAAKAEKYISAFASNHMEKQS